MERNSGTEADTSSLLNPAETGTSFSENKDGSTKKEKKRFDKDEQRAINFDLSLFWRLENFANLDGADAVESTERFDSFADERVRVCRMVDNALQFHGPDFRQTNGGYNVTSKWPPEEWIAR